MVGFIKMATLSAALSYGVVSAYNMPIQKPEAAATGKYQDCVLASEEVPASAMSRSLGSGVEMVSIARSTGKGDRLAISSASTQRLVTIES